MGFNLFGPPKVSDIRVGYISTDRGYVQGVSICEANSYAELNPGTTFIIKNRKKIEYKNINEVNNLKPVDVFVPAEDNCGGIQLDKPAGPVKVEFYGGGGVGAKGNPVIGKDGSVMAIHMVSRGHGYQYPPLVDIKDDVNGRGAGAVARVVGLGQTVIKTQVYSAEEEFEDYFPPQVKEFCGAETAKNSVGHGRRFSPDGKDVGPWNPAMYVSSEEDPILRQIAQFQEYLNALTDPWWFTRKEAPLNVVSDNEEGFIKRQKKLNFNPNRTVYPVQHWHWGGSILKHGAVQQINPDESAFQEEVFEIYTEGGEGKDLFFTFTEVDGKHVFTIKADNYTDGGEPRKLVKNIKPNVDYKVTSDGRYKKKNGTKQGLLKDSFGRRGRSKGLGTSSSIFAEVLGTRNDKDDLQILATVGKFKTVKQGSQSNFTTRRVTENLIYRLTIPSGKKGTVSSSQDANTRDSVEIARSFMNDHAISPVPMSNEPGSDFAGMLFTMEWEEEFPYPGEYIFKAQCDNDASFYLDGQQEIPKIAYYKKKPSVLKKNLNWEDSDKKGKVYKMRIDLLNRLQYKKLTIQEPPQADTSDVQYEEISTAKAKFEGTKLDDIFLVVTGEGTANAELKIVFKDDWKISGTALTELKCGDIKLTRTKGRKTETLTGTGKFVAGRYKVEVIGSSEDAGARIGDTKIEIDDNISNGFDLNATLMLKVLSVDPAKRRIKAPAKPKPPAAAGIKVQKVFNTVEWMNKANRQLWRTNVYGRGGFVNTAGICPFDTTKELDTNPYAGTHGIKWANVNFPIDGNYVIKAAVDDAVTLTFRGPSGETVIRKEGFAGGVGESASTGTSTYTRFFKKGNYTLDAALEQIPGGRFGFRKDKGKTVKDKEVSFKVTSAAAYANKITIPGLFSFSKEYKGADINQNVVKRVEVGKEYDVILTSAQKGSNFNSNRVKLRIKDGGKRLEMEEYKDDDFTDIVCTVTDGKFYSVQGNRCKFRLDETVKGINPMALAVDIEVAYATKTVVSAKSWNENPMGVAFTIKAPVPPTPIEEKPKQKGRCPNNPMWTTRFPTDNKWYPVRMDKDFAKAAGHKGGWSKFLNRYAISPVLPLPHKGTDQGGKVFTNTWNVDVPYDGWYQIKGEVDDIGRYYINDDLKLDLSRKKGKIYDESKFFLTAGVKKLRVEVENYSTVTYENVSKKVFSARDWRREPPVAPPPAARGILCHAGGGKGGTDNTEQLIGGKVIVGKGGDGGKGGDDNEFDKHHGGNGGGAGLRSGEHARNPITHSQLDSMSAGRYKGGAGGFGVNFTGSAVGAIQQTLSSQESSGGNGVAMGGGGGGNCRGGSGGNGGNGGVKIVWGLTGKSQEWTTPGVYNVTVPGGIGKKGKGGVPITAKFEGTNYDNLELVVSGTGTAQCTIKLDTHDSWTSKGVALTAMKCGSISLTRTKGEKSETLTGTGTFVGGKRYKVEIIGADKDARQSRIGATRVELLDTHKDDTNASLTLSTASEPTRDGVTIICIGGGGSGFMDGGGDRQGSGGSGGAYAWVNEDVESGKKLKIIVGKGGKGKNVQGAERGGDSYVELVSEPPPNDLKIVKQQKGKVSYSGPNLFHYTDNRWGKVMNKFGVSPANVDADLDKPSGDNVGRKILQWSNVDFPFKGQYDVLFAADNTASLFINGEQLLYAADNYTLSSDKSYDKINIGTPGRYDIKIELNNAYHGHSETRTHANDDVFIHNPSGVVLEIRKDVNVATNKGKSWTENPMGISGILIPPPCPKEVGGKGIVPDPIIDDPGNGYESPPTEGGPPGYPVILIIDKVEPDGPTINYNCGKDKVIMVPDLGYKFVPKCGPFGQITEMTVIPPDPPPPITSPPDIFIDSPTGVNFRPKITYRVVVIPPDVLPPEQILQVTDLAGIKQTGYYNGKPYYGAIYYDNGIKYAGWYETAGQPIQIYDTMQESIDATITTPPSAIQRQGSDITSNDPRLNIPGTPENLT